MTAPTASTAPSGTAGDARSEAAEAVLARYDELAALLAGISERPVADASLSAAAAAVLAHEARLLDSGRFEDWLQRWNDDAVLWVPLSDSAHPGTDQSLLLDDRRRLGERVEWRRDRTAWGQQPPSRTTRVVGSVEAWPTLRSDTVVARSSLLIAEQRHGRTRHLAAVQIHELVGEECMYRSKIIVVSELSAGVRNPSFLL